MKFLKYIEFIVIKATDYPKHLAVQNRWLNTYNNKEKNVKNVKNLNPQKLIVAMTVQIWYMIEGKKSLFTHNTIIPVKFIEKYKKENFTNLGITL
ncbi:MAG: hypothetical protein L3J23_05935 [Flavobacteriaceae bacterium]|nr:hypothetical protein [Flavobacteriaceae bacterium]